jgi:hypothetical protein
MIPAAPSHVWLLLALMLVAAVLPARCGSGFRLGRGAQGLTATESIIRGPGPYVTRRFAGHWLIKAAQPTQADVPGLRPNDRARPPDGGPPSPRCNISGQNLKARKPLLVSTAGSRFMLELGCHRPHLTREQALAAGTPAVCRAAGPPALCIPAARTLCPRQCSTVRKLSRANCGKKENPVLVNQLCDELFKPRWRNDSQVCVHTHAPPHPLAPHFLGR